jgi:hypothetical protein
MVTIQQKAEVEEIVATLAPDEVSQRQSVAFSIEVTNSGGVGVVLDAASRLGFTDGATAYEAFLAGQDTVDVGTSRVLALISDTIPQAMREGTYPIALYLQGRDLNGSQYCDTITTGGNEVTVETPASLEGLVSMVSADTVYWGQQNLSVDVVVQNGGGADALIDSTDLRFLRENTDVTSEYERTLLSSIDSLPGYSSDIIPFRVSVDELATEGWVTIHLRIFGRDANSSLPVSDTITAFPDSFCVLSYRCGDCNGDENISVADGIYLVTYIYRDGSPPLGPGDTNSDGVVSIADAIYLVSYIYRGGSPLCNPPGSTTPFKPRRM